MIHPSPTACACAHARERVAKLSLLFSWGGGCCLSVCVWDGSDWGGGLWLLCVLADSLFLCLSLSISISLSSVEHCVVTAGQSKTQKIYKKFDVRMISKWRGGQVSIGTSWGVSKEPFICEGPPSTFGGHVLRELAACCHGCSCAFFFL